MDVNTRNRAELKSYYVKNSIPTESNFAELIDGMLNQKDDGIVKLPGNPLSTPEQSTLAIHGRGFDLVDAVGLDKSGRIADKEGDEQDHR